MLDPYQDGFDWSSPSNNVLMARWPELCDMVAQAIVPALDKLIADPMGYPVEFDDDGGLSSLGVMVLGNEEEAVKRWTDVLTTMKAGFEAHIQLADDPPSDMAVCNQLAKDREEGLLLFAMYFEYLWS